MRFLIDTHAWLWFVLGNNSLPKSIRDTIADSGNSIFLSPASYWEIAIKISLGKYTLPIPFDRFLNEAIAGEGMTVIPVTPEHAIIVAQLPFHHRDPFDRLLIAQAIGENLPIISADSAFDRYGVQRVWENSGSP